MNEINELVKVVGGYILVMLCISYIFFQIYVMPIINRHIMNETGINGDDLKFFYPNNFK